MDMLRSLYRESLYSSGLSPVLITSVAALAVTLIALLIAQGRRNQLPPGPVRWPVLGSIPALSGGLPHVVLRNLANKYGGLMYLQFGSVPAIVVSNVEVSKELFQTQDATFLDRPKTLVFDLLTGYERNLVASNGRYWRDVRKLVTNELLTHKRLATYKSVREEEILNMMQILLEDAQLGRTVNLKSWLLGITCNNMTRMLSNKRYFGHGPDSRKEKDEFELLTRRSFESLGAFIISDFVPYLGFIPKWQGWHKTFKELRAFTTDWGNRLFEVEKHQERAIEREKRGETEGYVPDMVDLLLTTPLENGNTLPPINVRLILTDLLNAGTETSAGTVEFAMAELICRPEIMKQLQDELDTVIGPDRVPEESDIPNLPFLQAVVKENFRLHPPATINLPRESTKEFVFRGFKFPSRTRLLLNYHAIQRDPNVYDSPEDFKPERFWEHPEVNHLAAFEFYELTPFSAGRRMCPGAELGNTMVSLLLAHLVHGFDWALPQGVDVVDKTEQFGISVSLKNPLRLVAKAKSPASLYGK